MAIKRARMPCTAILRAISYYLQRYIDTKGYGRQEEKLCTFLLDVACDMEYSKGDAEEEKISKRVSRQ